MTENIIRLRLIRKAFEESGVKYSDDDILKQFKYETGRQPTLKELLEARKK